MIYQTLRLLRILFSDVGVGLARADILIINIVLPFASAVALLERDTLLNERALKALQDASRLVFQLDYTYDDRTATIAFRATWQLSSARITPYLSRDMSGKML